MLSTTARRLVLAHGLLIRQSEAAEVAALAQHSDPTTLRLSLAPHHRTGHRAGWPPPHSLSCSRTQSGL